MKKIILFILLAISINIEAQIVRPFIGFSTYLHWDFEKSSYFGLNSGVEFKVSSYFMPELEFSYFYGSLEDESRINVQYVDVLLYTRSASSFNFSFCPKIALGNRGDGTNFMVILPRYTFSKIEAKGYFSERNDDDTISESNEIQNDIQHSLGLGVGFDIALSDENTSSLCLILYYNGVNLGKVVNELEHSSGYEINAKGVLGAGINYYFGFKKKLRH
jgi:hypothetical protein